MMSIWKNLEFLLFVSVLFFEFLHSQKELSLRKSHTATNNEGDLNDNNENIHVIFSTDCSFFQDWQTLVVFHRY